jgi:polyphosphate kinase 2 (PPK2 family)
LLAQVDLTQSLSPDEYKQQLREEQTRFGKLQQSIYEEEIPVLVLFEGWDACR